MSQTRTILNYILNIRQKSITDEEPSNLLEFKNFKPNFTPVRLASIPRKPLTLRFPLSDCSDISLRQSREAVHEGIKFSVSMFKTLLFMNMMRKVVDDQQKSEEILAQEDPGDSDDLDVPSTVFEKMRLSLQLPSILVRSSPTNRDILMAKLQEGVLLCLQKQFSLSDAAVDDVRVREALNYATNVFLQNFKAATTKDLWSEISESGILADGLCNLSYDFFDKYADIMLDIFEDMVVDGCTEVIMRDPGATLEKPVFYDCFRAIWKLDPPDVLDFDVDVFISEYDDLQVRYYSSPLVVDSLSDKYGSCALKINIHRFFWCYRDELQARKCTKSTVIPNNLDKMEEFEQIRGSVHEIMICDEEQSVMRAKKSLRFADME